MAGKSAAVEADRGVEADSVASRFGVGVDALEGKLQAGIRNISPQINRSCLFIIIHLDYKVSRSVYKYEKRVQHFSS